MSRPTSAKAHTGVRAAAVLALALAAAACQSLGTGPKQARQPQDPDHPVGTIDPRDTSATPAPSRTLPIPGQSPNPIGVAPQGALPDPYANPPR